MSNDAFYSSCSATQKCSRSLRSPWCRHQDLRHSLNILKVWNNWQRLSFQEVKTKNVRSCVFHFHQGFILETLATKTPWFFLSLATLRRVFVDLFLLMIDKVRQWVFHFRLIEFTFENMCTPACVHKPLGGCVYVYVCVSLFVAI